MPQGTIKKLVTEKGFGFVKIGEKEDLFFHMSACDGVDFEDLDEGDTVEYEIDRNHKSDKGPRASRISVPKGRPA